MRSFDAELHCIVEDLTLGVSHAIRAYTQVAFITGRSEDSREVTVNNLKQEGFGDKCMQDGRGNVIRTENPCYVALHMRDLKSTLLPLST
jgi:hypothetical protein